MGALFSQEDSMVSSSSYATKWYITLFCNSMPFKTQLRLWDAYFLDGPNFLVIVSIAIIWAHRKLLAAPGADFETILSCLSSFYILEDEDAVLRWIRKMLGQRGMTEKMQEWRREWQTKKNDPGSLL